MTVEGCGSESLQGDVRFAEVMGLMGANVEWSPYSIKITGTPGQKLDPQPHHLKATAGTTTALREPLADADAGSNGFKHESYLTCSLHWPMLSWSIASPPGVPAVLQKHAILLARHAHYL